MVNAIRIIAVLGAILVASAGFAQVVTVPVRAGEHADYTRVAITLPADAVWQVTQDGRQIDLRVTGIPLQFDLTQTFARIPRTRLLSAQSSENGLSLTLACDCLVRTAEDLPQMLVIDIASQPEPARTNLTDAFRPMPRPDRATRSAAPVLAGQALARAMRQAETAQAPSTPALTLFPATVLAPQSQPTGNNQGRDDPVVQSSVDDQQTALAALGEGLSLAVSRGLLSPGRTQNSGTETQPLVVAPGANVAEHLSVSDSISRNRTWQRPPAQDSQTANCPDPQDLAIATWGSEQDFAFKSPDFGVFIDEANQFDVDAIRNGAKKFLYLGFGAEARNLLLMIPDRTMRDDLLDAIAFIVDDAPTAARNVADGLGQCGDMGALWNALAAPSQTILADLQIEQAINGVASLPPHLRLHLGPNLLRRLVAQQATRYAETLRDILARVSIPASASPASSSAGRRDLIAPADRSAPDLGLVNTDNPEEILFSLREHAFHDRVLSDDLKSAAQHHIFALRGTDLARDIAAELIRALGRSGDFEGAFALLDQPDPVFSSDAQFSLRDDVLGQVVAHENDAYFLAQVFKADPWTSPVAATTMMALADRMRDLGFDVQADQLRVTAETGPARSDVRLWDPDQRDALAVTAPTTRTGSSQARPQTASAPQTGPDPRRIAGFPDAGTGIMTPASLDSADVIPAVNPRPDATATGLETVVAASATTDAPELAAARSFPNPPDSDAERAAPVAPGPQTEQPPAPDSSGPLTESRIALEQSAALRSRLNDLLQPQDP